MSALAGLTLPPPIPVFWAWWTSELKAMLPVSLGNSASSRAQSLIIPERQSVTVERLVAGVGERHVDARSLDALDDAAWVELADLTASTTTQIRLMPPDCHVAWLTLPLAARGHLRSAVGLRLDDITPLEASLIVWTPQIMAVNGDSLSVAVTIARAASIAQLADLFAAHDIAMPPVVVSVDDADIVLDAGARHAASPETRSKRRLWAIVAALLISVPFTTILFAGLTTSSLDAKIAAAELRVRPKLAAERQWKADEALRVALLPVLNRPSASGLIEKLANTLPKTATAQSVDLALDQSLTFSADTSDAQALADAMTATPHLRDVTLVNETNGAPDQMRITYKASPR
jgi:hypothetical protein